MIPKISFYAKMEFFDNGGKTPKYLMTEQAGSYPPMERIKGRNGIPYFYLMENRSKEPDAPPMKLQARDSFNFTGIKNSFVDGKISHFAFGTPFSEEFYGKDRKKNPFYEYRGDGYLFILDDQKNRLARFGEKEIIIPIIIELLIVEGGLLQIPTYCKMLQMGGFDEAINELRKQAKAIK